AAHERQRAPEVEPLLLRVLAGCRDDGGAVVEDRVEELLPGTCELVGQLLGLAAREEVAFLPLRDVGTAALNEVGSEAASEGAAHEPLLGGLQPLEVRVQEAEEPEVGV